MKSILCILTSVILIIFSISKIYSVSVTVFIDVGSLIIVLGLTMMSVIARHTWSEIKSISTQKDSASEVVRTIFFVAPASGLIGSVIGLTQMLQHISSVSEIGPGMAAALLSTMYGAILSISAFMLNKTKFNLVPLAVIGLGAVVSFSSIIILTISMIGFGTVKT